MRDLAPFSKFLEAALYYLAVGARIIGQILCCIYVMGVTERASVLTNLNTITTWARRSPAIFCIYTHVCTFYSLLPLPPPTPCTLTVNLLYSIFTQLGLQNNTEYVQYSRGGGNVLTSFKLNGQIYGIVKDSWQHGRHLLVK